MTTPHFCLAAPRFSWCDRARVLPNHDEDHESQTQGRPLDVVFGYDPTPISSVTPVWLRRSTPCVFVVHIRPQPVNDTRVVRSPARTLGSAVDGSFFPPFPAEKKFSCGCAAAVSPPPLRIEPRHRSPRFRGDGHIVSDQAHSFPRPSPSTSIPSWARASPTVPAAATARAGFPTGRVGVPTDRSGFD